MRTIKIHLRKAAMVLAALILFPGCTVYKSANVTLEEASRAESVVRVKTNENKSHKYDRVGFENDYYYGLNYKTGDDLKVRLDENRINKVQVKDRTASTVLTVGSVAILLGAMSGLLFIAFF